MEHEKESSSSSQSPPEPHGLRYILVSALAFFYGWSLANRYSSNDESRESVSPHGGTGKETNGRPIEPFIIPQVTPPPVQTNQSNGRKDNTPRWKKVVEGSIASATIGLLIANIVGLYITNSTLHELQQQTNLIRQQLTSVKGARCDITYGINEEIVLYVQANNDSNRQGRVDALHFEGSFEVTRQSMDTGKIIWQKSEPIKLHKPQIASGMNIAAYEKIADFSNKDKNFGLLEHRKETIVVQGPYQYDDGFGDLVLDSFCVQFIGRRLNNGQYQGISPELCMDVPLILSRDEQADAKIHP